MPIKFRCQHCRQFLGISRERAGDIFDCPTCGRSLRVPDLDGSVRPLPKVKMNLADSELRKALDELADLDQPSAQSAGDAIEFDALDEAGRSTQPKPEARPEIIPVVPQPAPKPIELQPIVPLVREPQHIAGRGTQQGDAAWKAVVELAEGDSSESLVPQAEPQPDGLHPNLKTPVVPGVARGKNVELGPSFWFAVAGALATVFTAGFWTGRLTVSPPIASIQQSEPVPTELPGKAEQLATIPVAASIRGRITYRPEAGANKPDRGARVIALPLDWAGKTKLQTIGFRAADSADDQRIARASLQAMGGDLVVTDESGEFSLSLPSGGQFLLVVLSGSMPRPEADDTQSAQQQLSPYFDRPLQLLGKVMVHVERMSWSGGSAQPWDHVFQRG